LGDITRLFTLLATAALTTGDLELRDAYVQCAGNLIGHFRDEVTPIPRVQAVTN
jgi:hypothetical protein